MKICVFCVFLVENNESYHAPIKKKFIFIFLHNFCSEKIIYGEGKSALVLSGATANSQPDDNFETILRDKSFLTLRSFKTLAALGKENREFTRR